MITPKPSLSKKLIKSIIKKYLQVINTSQVDHFPIQLSNTLQGQLGSLKISENAVYRLLKLYSPSVIKTSSVCN
jgi:hypothetical protein